ncbi:MAG: hypothetical protein DSY83_07035 [Flavobacteriia bacterium]|nr:MAG: hypothetical protein DSY83_07035 [Flavobacteriia bacterium]
MWMTVNNRFTFQQPSRPFLIFSKNETKCKGLHKVIGHFFHIIEQIGFICLPKQAKAPSL